jgi:hypothetical protein
LLYESAPQFGDYIYSPITRSWTQRRVDATGRKFVLCGRGRQPSDEQIAMWSEAEARLPELTRAAASAAGALLVGSHADAFTEAELWLSQVRFESDGTLLLFLGFPRSDDVGMWPMVTFSNWTACRAKWIV